MPHAAMRRGTVSASSIASTAMPANCAIICTPSLTSATLGRPLRQCCIAQEVLQVRPGIVAASTSMDVPNTPPTSAPITANATAPSRPSAREAPAHAAAARRQVRPRSALKRITSVSDVSPRAVTLKTRKVASTSEYAPKSRTELERATTTVMAKFDAL